MTTRKASEPSMSYQWRRPPNILSTILIDSTQMRERFVRNPLMQKLTQLSPAIAMLPTHDEQIAIDPVAKVFEHVAVVPFITARGEFVIPVCRLDSKNLIPPMRLDEVFAPDPLTLVMALQTPHVRCSIFPQRKNELATGKSLVQLAVDRKPRPIVKRLKLLRLRQHLVNLI